MNSPSVNLKVIACKTNFTAAVLKPHPEEIHVD
jgi:hypothetical protein